MKPTDFVHLHCHSTYSLLEGLPRPEEIVLRAKELKQTAVGLADKGHTHGLIEFYQAAKNHDIKPILGYEAYIAARTRHDKEREDTKRYPITLLAENKEGYQNLLELSTYASLEGMYYKPRIDAELMKKYGKGIIALSGPIGGLIPQAAVDEDEERIKELVEKYRSFFGKDNLYFELMDLPNVTGQAEANQQLIRIGKELDVPVVATCNSHYCRKDDADAHDVLLCIQKNANVEDTSRFSMMDSDFSMREYEEMEKAFSHVPEAMENTRVIADRCSLDFEFGKYRIPKFDVPKGSTESSYLRKLCEEGMDKRYGKNPDKEVKERLDYELGIIDQMGFSGYFLIVADFVSYAKKKGITVGPGRGSAAGSIVSYCLDVTTLDPLEHGLLFERFLNPERVEMPDIDLDFADIRRDEVLEYVADKYGRDRVVQICTFGTLAARAAVKDVGRAYGVPFVEMNELVKLIPEKPGTQLKDALETAELSTAYNGNDKYKTIIDTAIKLEGKARHVSVHACGVIITQEPTVKYTALQKAPKDDKTIITQYSAKPLAALGLLKMDFLGLKNLSIIQTTLETIERLQGKKINMSSIKTNDKKTFKLLAKADTTGVFQLESGGMRRYLKQLKPTEFEDITAMVSLFRPGPMEWIPDYIKRKHGKAKVKYIHNDLEPILKPTYGIGIYQEQILEMARVFANFSLGEADLLRRAIGKKIKKELDAQREKFIKGAVGKGYEEKLAIKIFDDVILPFAGYGFNKSHAACYAQIAYETAYLKAHYPTEFMAAMLSADSGNTDRVTLEIAECRAMGIEVLPPDINESDSDFTPLPDNKIRFGLTAIKGVGESSVKSVLDIREETGKFESIEDFAGRVPAKLLNKKLIEAMAKSGALDCFGERTTLVEHYEKVAEFSKAAGDVGQGQTDLFSVVDENIDAAKISFPETEPASQVQRLQWEKETLGLYVSSHPLAGLKKYIGKKAMLIENFTKDNIGKKVTVAGIAEGIKKITTKKGETMAIVFFEDPTGKLEITLFPRTYARVSEFLEGPDVVLVVGGTLDYRVGQMQIRADAVKKASLPRMIERAKESGFYDEEEAKNGISISRISLDEPEVMEAVDEDGNVIAGETVSLEKEKGDASDLVGDLAGFVSSGMKIEDAMKGLENIFGGKAEKKTKKKSDKKTDETTSSAKSIKIHTIDLPDKAPKQLLMDLKSVLDRFPGNERIQFKIGSKNMELPITVTMSTILEKKVEEAMEKHGIKKVA
ncbi:DNA polymerase III subunit alpha [Candidatus Peribacteria bacterium]|nr:DNA polymerase III subunit alpha [Candidatus Peribacteria bacterium]MBT4021432.1 DNA polymerase III subunit alpha [Candidatus Peribacteria bacterium]MBT4240448.1 DNA polymerase III subunit alpha [Candidatus Peribacteria bacterium]MBT4474530.1 DNA polymerase III subunit alpha [Candidatus Peribacteria bacterium]